MILPSDAVEVRIDASVATVVLSRPDDGNAFTRSMLAELREALEDLHREKRVRAIVLTGAGDAFCVGRDPRENAASDDEAADLVRWGEQADEYRELLVAMLELPKPLIAAVNGPATAGGAGFVLACDVAVACEAAEFGFPEPRRGVVAGVAAPLLAFRVGAGLAARLLVTAAPIPAAEAHRTGIYHELVAPDLVWARAAEIGRETSRAAPQAVQLTKRVLHETIGEQLSTQLTGGAVASATALTTDAAREGQAATESGREPEWG